MLLQDLQKIGFSDKEAACYLASLELGPATILEISRQTKIKRPTVYVIIEGFIKKGLASSFEKGKKRYFTVESPGRLLTLFNLKERELEEQKREFSTLLPELKQVYSSGLIQGKPVVKFFEGKEGIEAVRQDIIQTKTKLLREFTSLDDAYDYFPPKSNDHRKEMAKKIEEVRTIYTSKKGITLPKEQSPYFSRPLSFTQFPFFCDFVSYGNKIAFLAYKEKLIEVVIENESIAKTINSIFDYLWEKEKG